MTMENFEKVGEVIVTRITPMFARMEAKIDKLAEARANDSAALQVLQSSVRSLGHRVSHLEQVEEEFERHQRVCAGQRSACPAADIKKLQWSLVGAIALLLATTGLKAMGVI